jgi:energy-coupling factor transporter ATP-binding protein EcfA2/histidinol phosphatase-like PHP family hydrolase
MVKNEFILEQFNEIVKRESMSKFYKVDLHIHTPASINDYKFNGKYYESSNLENLKEMAILKELSTKENIDALNVEKDEITALLIIHEACAIKELNMIVVTDHNNIEWYEKLISAAQEYFTKYNPKNKFARDFSILPGVEITCFNGAHIIAILEPLKYIENWNYLRFELGHQMGINKEIFTTKSEMDVIQAIKKVGGIVYIPHIDNNSQKLKMDDILDPMMGISKAELFINDAVQAIGFTQYDKFKPFVENILKDQKHRYYRKLPLAYIQDSDAHNIEEIGQRFMYIKMSKLSFESLKFALEEPEIRVKKVNEENKDTPYIRGVVTDGGFLSRSNGKKSYYPFNKDLNCIIGGRGTGKSTLINCIKSCIEGKVEKPSFRRFIGMFNIIMIYFYVDNKNYCLLCEPTIRFDSYTGDEINKNGARTKQEQTNIENWIKVYEVGDAKVRKLTINRQVELLSDFHIDFFKQAQVYKIGEDENYLKDLISTVFVRCSAKKEYALLMDQVAKELKYISSLIDSGSLMDISLIKRYLNFREKISEINNKIHQFREEIIDKLNENMRDKVVIKYIEDNDDLNSRLQALLDNHSSLNSLLSKEVSNISKCISFICEKYDFTTLWETLLGNAELVINDVKNGNVFISERVEDIVEDREIEKYISIAKELLVKYIRNVNQFKENYSISVEFNVNSYTSSKNSKLFKSLSDLSLGQKAVAILLIITEGINGIVRTFPLIIDQPEDHLDNKFIYEHLVKSIRKLKEERQVILVTHNANIPVSGDAENIIHLMSDNNNGWIDLYGPIDDMEISGKVLSIMEGGKESFDMRKKKYKILKYIS